ncbi:MAG: hypothetical protein EOP10_28565 [Proteobacteria bacterium]|nr:MAG: hypothetical protein EOP10_28565 [Pseudomonadota bacterium]
MVIVGVLVEQPAFNPQLFIMGRKTLGGSLIGSIAETKEVLEFAAKHGIYPRVEVIKPDEINDAYKKVEKKKARYRYVIDLAALKQEDRESLDELDPVTHLLDKSKKSKMPKPPVHADDSRLGLKPQWSQDESSASL